MNLLGVLCKPSLFLSTPLKSLSTPLKKNRHTETGLRVEPIGSGPKPVCLVFFESHPKTRSRYALYKPDLGLSLGWRWYRRGYLRIPTEKLPCINSKPALYQPQTPTRGPKEGCSSRLNPWENLKKLSWALAVAQALKLLL